MNDSDIIELYFERSENAIVETEKKYQKYCYSIAFNILGSREDAEECVNDIYTRLWNSIPPQRPNNLSAFMAKIVRNLSFDRYHQKRAEKRWKGQREAALDELVECLPDTSGGDISDELILKDALNEFLRSLAAEERQIFVKRYFYMCSIKSIAKVLKMGESKVKMSLHRSREKLREYLKREGIEV